MKIRLLVTNSCPAKCIGCHNEYQEESHNDLSLKFINVKDITNMMIQLKEMNHLPNEVVISGGEPSLFNELGILSKSLYEIGIPHISLNSNCVGWSNIISTLPWIHEIKVHVEDIPHESNMNAYIDTMGLSNNVLNNIKTIPSLLKPSQCRYINTIMRSESQVQRILTFSEQYGFHSKLIEESLLTTDKVSYSKGDCANYLINHNYTDISSNSSVFESLNKNHKVYIRQCISSCGPLITINHLGIVNINWKHHTCKAYRQEVCNISEFPYSSLFE